jgi:hypothetical protein
MTMVILSRLHREFREIFPGLINGALVIALASCLSGCATIGHDSRNQAVLIRSEPPGATITMKGNYVGQTPMYVLVPREKHPKLTLSRDHHETDIELKTKYRWGASFFSNLVFYIGAPVGWLVDVVSGSAWNPQDPDSIVLPGKKTRDEALPPPANVAIAPPKADTLELSNAALPVLEEAINERKKILGYHLLPYEKSLPLFLARGFDFDGSGTVDEQRMLNQSLEASGVWHSAFIRKGPSLILEAELEDTRTHKIIDEIDLTLDPSDERSKAFTQGFHFFELPNAVTFSLSTQYFTFDRPGFGSVSLQAADTHVWWQKGLQYLSTISITNLPVYRPGRSGRWSLNFIPMLRLSRRDLVANGSKDIDGQNFTRWLGAVGYGPEIGYQIGKHYLYLDLNVYEVWTNVSWSQRGQDFSVTQSGQQIASEVGYLYLYNDIWSARVFFSSFPENSDVWREALNKSSNGSIGSSNEGVANNSTIGISLGFSFEPFLVRTFREKIRKAPNVSPAPNQAAR